MFFTNVAGFGVGGSRTVHRWVSTVLSLFTLCMLFLLGGCNPGLTPFLKVRPVPTPDYQPEATRNTTPGIKKDTLVTLDKHSKQETDKIEDAKNNANVIDLSVDDDWILGQLPPEALALLPVIQGQNRSLQRARESFLSAQWGYQTAQGFLLPSASVSANKGVNVTDNGTTHSTGFGLGASWSIDLWRDLGIKQRMDLLAFKQAQLGFRQTYTSTVRSILAQWISLVAVQADLRIQRDQLSLLAQVLEATKGSYLRGIIEIEDVILFQNDIDGRQELLAAAEQRFKRQVRALQLELGQYPDGQMDFSSATLDIKPLSASLPKDFPAKLVARRVDIQQAWLGLLQSDIGLALAHQNLFPSMRLSLSSNFSADTLSELFRKSNGFASMGASVAAQVLKRGDLKREKVQAASGVKVAELSYQDTTYNAFLDVEQLFEDEAKLYARFLNLQDSQANAAKAESTEIQKYLNREASFSRVIDVQDSVLELRAQLLRLKESILLNRLSLYVAMGGTFNADDEMAKHMIMKHASLADDSVE